MTCSDRQKYRVWVLHRKVILFTNVFLHFKKNNSCEVALADIRYSNLNTGSHNIKTTSLVLFIFLTYFKICPGPLNHGKRISGFFWHLAFGSESFGS